MFSEVLAIPLTKIFTEEIMKILQSVFKSVLEVKRDRKEHISSMHARGVFITL